MVLINPSDADAMDLKDNDKITIFNELGEITVRATISDKVQVGVIWAPRQFRDFDGNPQNSLTSGHPQKLGGGPVFNSTAVRIKRG